MHPLLKLGRDLWALGRQASSLLRWRAELILALFVAAFIWWCLAHGGRRVRTGGEKAGPVAAKPAVEPPRTDTSAPVATRQTTPAPKTAPMPSATADRAQRLLEEGTALFKAGDRKRAFECFRQAAELGDPRAQLQTGWQYENGAGVAQNYSAAAHWYRQAAERGNATAMKNLGQLCENGQGVPEDWPTAARWYRQGAEQNDASAESALGRAYQFGIGVPQDREVSIYWNERALIHGDASCERWVRWLRDPTNNIGFRDEDEQALVLGNRLRTSGLLLGADPAGILFHNSAERIEWLRGLRNAVARDEAASRRRTAELERQQAQNSRQRHESEVRRLQAQGYSRDAAENRAGW